MALAIVVAGVPYVWVLWDLWMPSINPLQSGTPGALSRSAYDVQARAIMGGHFIVPNGSIGTEAFVHDGHQYTYFGIFPSLLRIPIFLFTHALDGRLTAVSMLGAWLVTALFERVVAVADPDRLPRGGSPRLGRDDLVRDPPRLASGRLRAPLPGLPAQ